MPIPEPPDIDRKWPINKHPAIARLCRKCFWLSLIALSAFSSAVVITDLPAVIKAIFNQRRLRARGWDRPKPSTLSRPGPGRETDLTERKLEEIDADQSVSDADQFV